MNRLDDDVIDRMSNTCGSMAELVGRSVIYGQGDVTVDFSGIRVERGEWRGDFDDYGVRKRIEQNKMVEEHIEEIKHQLARNCCIGDSFKILNLENEVLFTIDGTSRMLVFSLIFGEFDSTPVQASHQDTVATGWLWDRPIQCLVVNGVHVVPPRKYRYNYVLFVDGDSYDTVLQHVFSTLNRRSPRMSPQKKRQKVSPAPQQTITKSEIKEFKVVNQIDNRFILVRAPDKLVMIDQHAADERIRVEKLLTTLEDTIEVDYEVGIPFLEQFATNLRQAGIIITATNNGCVVTRIPEILNGISKVHLVQSLEQHHNHLKMRLTYGLPQVVLETANLVACKSAIKFGDKLTMENMQWLVETLSQCDDPFQCAHGRPTMVVMNNLMKQ